MAELMIIRHGQAAFGQDDYDVLSDLGREQSRAVAAALRRMDWVPDRVITGTLRRQKDTLAAMELENPPERKEHAGFNEYDFHDLFEARFGARESGPMGGDRRSHFRLLRETIFAWQDAEFDGASETWEQFAGRIAAARVFATETTARRVLVISSGGVIGQLVATALGAPARQMMELNLQIKNTAMTRFMFKDGRFTLHEFNATPHFADPEGAALLSYS
jgi:broad specificity phosphatase PhoE